MINQPKKIVISRTDSIGDVALTLPLAGILKEKYPNTNLIFLGNTYTKPILNCCEHIDEIWEWSELENLTADNRVKWLKSQHIDTFIHVFPRKEIAKMVKRAGIQHRIGTSHRFFHLNTCNHKPNFTRKNSDLHEAQLNTKLLAPLGINKEFSLKELDSYAGFTKISELPDKFQDLLNPSRKNIIFHAKSKGSAVEWGVNNFIELASDLDTSKYNIFFTGTEKEAEHFRKLLPEKDNIFDLSGKMTLDELISFISKSDLLLAASTGPLHIAGLTGISTIGLFSPEKPIHAGRWKPLGDKVLTLISESNSDSTQPIAIKLRDVKKEIEISL